MNLILLSADDFIAPERVRLSGRRFGHIRDVHRAEPGRALDVGVLNGLMGKGEVIALDETCVELKVKLDTEPPAPLPVTVLLALPRPKMLKRSLQTLASMGVKEIVLINSYRVEKSFWSSPWLTEAKIREQLLLGLEQAEDTRMPEVRLEKRFKPFVEDRLPALLAGKTGLIAHPGESRPCPAGFNQSTVLAIGPEGGFIPYEVELMKTQGMTQIHLGRRILRVETAVPVLLSRLFDPV